MPDAKKPRPAWLSGALQVVKHPAVITFLLGSLPIGFGFLFVTGHLITDPASKPSTWPFPIPFETIVIAIAETWALMMFAGLFMYAGIPMSGAPISEEAHHKISGLQKPRFWLFASLLGSTVLTGAAAYAMFHLLHRSIDPRAFFCIPIAGFAGSMTSAIRLHGVKHAISSYAYRSSAASIFWIVGSYFTMNIVESIAKHQAWKWNGGDPMPWLYLVLFLTLSSMASLMISERRWLVGTVASGFLIAMVGILDPTDFFALPFRLLHLS